MQVKKLDLEHKKFTIPEIRFMMGMNQEEFAKLIGLSKIQLWGRENGRTEWTMKEISDISEITGVPLDRITI